MRGVYGSLKNLLSAMRGIRVEPCLLQNAARHISGCYGDLCAAEINGNHKLLAGKGSELLAGKGSELLAGKGSELLAGKGSEVVGACSERVVIHKWVHPLAFVAIRLTPLSR